MYRQIPQLNKICQKRVVDQDQIRLESRVKNAQAQIDTSSPATFEYVNTINKKKNQILENKYTEIERENRILLEKITKVMSKEPQQKTQQQKQQVQQQSQFISNKKSLNSAYRKKELVKITVENQNFLKRLQSMKSDYEQKKQMRSWNEQQEIVSRISEFGANNRGLISKSSMQSRSVPKGIQIDSQENNEQSQNIPQSAHLSYRQKITKENNEVQPLKKRIGSGCIGNGNQIQRNHSGIANNKKVQLLKKSKKIGLNYYLIDISIEDGVFRIVADDAVNPTRKVLEMTESDGTKILKKYFGNSLEQMLESIWITDKIFIRGLEMFTEEQNQQNNNHSPNKYIAGQISKTQPIDKQRQLAPLNRSNSNKQISGEGAKLYNKQVSNHSQIIEQPEQESIEMSTSNVYKYNIPNNKEQFKNAVTEEDEILNKSGKYTDYNKIAYEQYNKSVLSSKSQKIDEDGFNEYGDEDYDDNESEHIKQIKSNGTKEDNLNLSDSQNIQEDF